MRQPLPPSAQEPLETGHAASMLAAARSSLAVFGAFALQSAADQFQALRESSALAAAKARSGAASRAAAGGATATAAAGSNPLAPQTPKAASATGSATLQLHLQNHASELRRLPSALQLWAEAAMDEEGVDDPATRAAVLTPLAEVAVLASRGAAAAEVVLRSLQQA